MTRCLLICLAAVAGSAPARAEVVTRPVEYRHGAAALEGLLVFDSATPGKRPGVLLAHEHGADGALARAKAGQLARLGYVIFSLDLYGKGVRPKDAADAAARLRLAGKDRAFVRERVRAAHAVLEKTPQVDAKRLAAVGYGAGGTAVLELARSKVELEGVVCVHGDLTPTGADGKSVSASLLVLMGADDPKTPLAQVAAFEDEMRKGGWTGSSSATAASAATSPTRRPGGT
jgi:dienelactone hydrolase